MKIAIFGDSYSAPNDLTTANKKSYRGWPEFLGLDYKIDNFADGGTSVWWSYELFLKHYTKYDIIIFCHSTFQRWPCVPVKRLGKNLHGDVFGNDPLLKDVAKYYFDIFPPQLLKFICQQVAYALDETCNASRKKLIQIFTEYEPVVSENNNMRCSTIFNMGHIDRLEHAIVNGKSYPIRELLANRPDLRSNHLSETNNKLFAQLIRDVIDSPKKVSYNCSNITTWQKHDESLNKIYGKL